MPEPQESTNPVERSASRLLKSDTTKIEPAYPTSRLLKSNTIEAVSFHKKARDTLESAETQRDKILAKAKEEAEQIRSDAEREGRRAGLQAIEPIVAAMSATIQNSRKEIEKNAAQLTLIFARKILNAELSASQTLFVDLVRNALEKARYYEQITIVLHPDDIDLIRAADESLLDQFVFASSIQFREDRELNRFGCRIETEMGAFEASLDGQLERLSQLLADQGNEFLNMGTNAEPELATESTASVD